MKINVNNLYVASLHMLKYYRNNYCISDELRKVVVYRDGFGFLYDLNTGNRYKRSIDLQVYNKFGTLFIELHDGLIPLSKVIDFEEDKIEKTKILKKVKTSNIE